MIHEPALDDNSLRAALGRFQAARGEAPTGREPVTATARYAATVYAAAQGQVPGGDEIELGSPSSRNRQRYRWALTPRAALVGAGALLAVGLAIMAISFSGGGGKPPVEIAVIDDARLPFTGETTEVVLPEIVVDVVGQVHNPTVVRLPAGSRVADAVAAAGGALAGADVAAINLARVLVDGEQVRVPAPGEEVPESPPVEALSGEAGKGGGLIDVNTADATTLQQLPGIGPALSGRIIAWRELNGPFASIDELAEVSGIGPAILASLRPLVTV